MSFLESLECYLLKDDTKLIYILALIMIANLIDFSIGWLKARLDPNVKFSSSQAIFGIARKIFLFIMLVIFIPFSLLLPKSLGLTGLYILYMGYLVSEMISIIGHLSEGKDDKTVDMFTEFIALFSGKGGNNEK